MKNSALYMKERHILLNFIIVISLLLIIFILPSCTNEDEPEIPQTQNTIFMYMPWSGNLTSYFYQNIKDMESNICQLGGLSNDRVIVFMSTSSTEASMYEIVYEDGVCEHTPIDSYTNYPFTTESGLTELLLTLKSVAPAKNYSMIIGCHGMGWLPVNRSRAASSEEKYHFEYEGGEILTRFFGGTTSDYQTEISTLSNALNNADLRMQYILFDDCYMSSIEVAYELKDVTDYLIASTCEVMAYGMPYATMGKHLLGKPNYKAVCEEFYKFYSNYEIMPCGTLAVTDCSQLGEMANIMRRINNAYNIDSELIGDIQKLDGYYPTIFFDYGDYVNKLLEHDGAGSDLIGSFNRQLELTVPFKTNTETYFTSSRGPMPIATYSGITTSDPSISSRASQKYYTKWYRATH